MSTNLIKVLKVLLGDEQFVNPIRNDTTRVGSLLTKKFSLIWRRIQSLVESGILSIFGIRDIKQGGGIFSVLFEGPVTQATGSLVTEHYHYFRYS